MISFVLTPLLLYSLYLLVVLFVIDLKTRLLPNIYVLQFLICGLIFNAVTHYHYTLPTDMVLAALFGGGLLFAIRGVGNKIYKTDTLGMGDVKLIGAAGVWLGIDFIFLAISLGAFAGLLHGIIYSTVLRRKTGTHISLTRLSIPAGPGFIIGILLAALIKFQIFSSGQI